MNCLKSYWDEVHPELSNFASKNLRDQASRADKGKANRETAENSCMLQHYNENGKWYRQLCYFPGAAKQTTSFYGKSLMQELRDTDALKEKRRNIFDCNTVIVSTTSKENENIVLFQQKQTKRLN